MPYRKNFQRVAIYAVVKEVFRAIEEKPAHLWRTASLNLGTEVRLIDKNLDRLLNVQSNSAGSGAPILRPPLGRSLYLALGARLDPIRERHG